MNQSSSQELVAIGVIVRTIFFVAGQIMRLYEIFETEKIYILLMRGVNLLKEMNTWQNQSDLDCS